MKLALAISLPTALCSFCFIFASAQAPPPQVPEGYLSPARPVPAGNAPAMQYKLVKDTPEEKVYAVVFHKGDEALSGLTDFAMKTGSRDANFTGIDAISGATLAWLDLDKKLYKRIAVSQQEMTFILPADAATEAREGVRVRIFSTEEEFPFAGHPTLGTASWLHLNHPLLKGAKTVTLKLNVGPIAVRFSEREGPGVYGTMQQNDPVFGVTYDAAEVAGVLCLGVDAIDAACAVQTVSTGMAFCIVPMASMEALGRLEIPQAAADRWLRAHQARFFYCIARAREIASAQMQFYNGEDPATGSAAGCAAAWMVRHGWLASGVEALIEQGLEIRRPSLITILAREQSSKISGVFVGGRTIPVAAGRFFLP